MKRYSLILIILLFVVLSGKSQGSLTDIDGNIYTTMVIGQQEWMGEHLKTTRYSNGDLISVYDEVLSLDSVREGAWIYYDHLEENNALYGKLYNFYAVSDARGLCPQGWRVPDAEDIYQLAHFVDADSWGNNNHIGSSLKSQRQVNSPLGDPFSTTIHPRWDEHERRFGKDAFGFNFLPAGAFSQHHGFLNKGSYGYLWTQQAISEDFGMAIVMLHSHKGMSQSAYHKGTALSVRCLREVEIPLYTLDLSVEPLATGSVSGSGTYPQGQQISLTAEPAAGFSFVEWKNEGGESLSEAPEISYTMPASNSHLTAVFEAIDFTVREFPWTEDFETVHFPPLGWQINNQSGPARQWTLADNGDYNITPGGFRNAFHEFGPFDDGMQKGWFISVPVAIPEGSNFNLSFWSYNEWPSWYGKNSVLISAASSNPQDFVEVWTTDFVLSEWENTVIDLSEFAGQTIYIAFRYEGHDAHSWHLDDVTVGAQ